VRIEQLLERHGVAKRERLQLIADHLGLAYQQVRRRMLGNVDWSLDDIQRLGERFGETLDQVVSGQSAANATSSGGGPAMLVIGDLKIPCVASIGLPLSPGQHADLVAVQLPGGEINIQPMSDVRDAVALQVLGVSVKPELHYSTRRRVAVLDDDQKLAANTVAYMQSGGLDAMAFHTVAGLISAIASTRFDGYVIDWLVSEESALNLIVELRRTDPNCAIVVLTGQLAPGNVNESELIRLASTYRLSYFEKPTRTSSIMSTLEVAFERRPAD
jgi:ActR/RegA family two-component response regulator